jgi:hypothetical protein
VCMHVMFPSLPPAWRPFRRLPCAPRPRCRCRHTAPTTPIRASLRAAAAAGDGAVPGPGARQRRRAGPARPLDHPAATAAVARGPGSWTPASACSKRPATRASPWPRCASARRSRHARSTTVRGGQGRPVPRRLRARHGPDKGRSRDLR